MGWIDNPFPERVSCPQDLATPKSGDAGFLSAQRSMSWVPATLSGVTRPEQPTPSRHDRGRSFNPTGVTIVLCFALVSVASTTGLALGAEPGSIADWIAAIATVGALGAAGVAAVFAFDALRREQGRDVWRDEQQARAEAVAAEERQDRLRHERRAQASKVACWVDKTVRYTSSGIPQVQYRVAVRNASDVPVTRLAYKLRSLRWDGGELTRKEVGLVPPSQDPLNHRLTVAFPDPDLHPEDGWVGVDVFFTDSSGVTWYRNARGPLYEITDPPPVGLSLLTLPVPN